jgi:hypothetical protein
MKFRSVKVRLAEACVILGITHYTFRPPSPGHSADNPVERSQSAITQAAASAEPRPGETQGKFANLTLAELKEGKVEVDRLPAVARAAMMESSWEGVRRLASLCRSEPCMGSVLTAFPAERGRAPLFCDDDYLKAFCKASERKRLGKPGGLHFQRMEDFLVGHSVVGHEKHYLEFVVNGCREQDDYECTMTGRCCRPDLESPSRIPVPIPASADNAKVPQEKWEHYLGLEELPIDSRVLYGIDNDINKFTTPR